MASLVLWDEASILRLRQLWSDGHSTATIGKLMGLSKNSVVGKAHRLNLESRPSPIMRSADGELPKRRRRAVPRPVVTLAPLSSLPPPDAPLPRTHVKPAPAPLPKAVATTKLDGLCCWPIGEPGTRAFRFCDDPCPRSGPYCAAHAARARSSYKPKMHAVP